jgi:adenine-specific DNA methylase
MSDSVGDVPRLIEHAFPLKQTSLDSVHEKNVRHGHISTLHIWPARRPLAACRAALIATLLPDPSAEPKPEGLSDAQWEEEIRRRRKELCEKIGGRVVTKTERKRMPNGQIVERLKEETEGGILHWGRETENAETLEWFRQEIRKAYGGRAPKVLDPFAGGGAIPLEAMRLGCEATAIDINPVAWFILKCTLEYPQKFAGQTRPLPEFVLHDDEFMREYFVKARGYGKREVTAAMKRLHERLETKSEASPDDAQEGLPFSTEAPDDEFQANLAWHVRAWGRWVLVRARKDLAPFYPTYADFEPLDPGKKAYERQPMRLLALKDDDTPDLDAVNAEFSEEYLADKRNPRWVAKPTVAYLWARTVTCKNCRATVPLLKTRWLCKKANKRVLFTMEPNADRSGVVFCVEANVPVRGGNAAQRREHDKRIGAGTMTRAGAKCACCGTIMTGEDCRVLAGRGGLGELMTAVVVVGSNGKEYTLPRPADAASVREAAAAQRVIGEALEGGFPSEPIPEGASRQGGGSAFTVYRYGLDQWRKLFSARQLLAVGTFVLRVRAARSEMANSYSPDWREALLAYLSCGFDRMLDFNAATLSWITSVEAIGHTFVRFALPMTWDFAEAVPINAVRGGWEMCLGAVMESQPILAGAECARVEALNRSALEGLQAGCYDAVVTDPPYYDAIPYSDLMDYFYVWQRRTLRGVSAAIDEAYAGRLSPKWDQEKNDGELIDDASRHGNDAGKSRAAYEDGMARVFLNCRTALTDAGRLVIVFANKQPDAWATLVSAIIRAGFVVDGSWPIQTEQAARMRAQSSSALASSVWLVAKKRSPTARPGWDSAVLAEMRENVAQEMRGFWDAGIRGPDFVWAATGPALEAYSKYPVVRKADTPDEVMSVSEFLTHVRRMVVDFVVGRVLSGDGEIDDQAAADRLDEPTAYYLLHRNDFGMDDAPAGTCILYAVSCGLSDKELVDTWDILARTSGGDADDDEEDDAEADADDATDDDEGSGSKLKLKTWAQRKARTMGYEAPGGRPIPLIDRVHRLMHLWKAQDVHKVDEYLDDNALRRNELFKRFLQSLVELSPRASEERSLLESLSSHVGAKGAKRDQGPGLFGDAGTEEGETGQ